MTAPLLIVWTLLLTQPPAEWPCDEFVHANGATFRGLILAESKDELRFQVITRRPGRPTVTLTTVFTAAEIGSLKRLSDADRAVLKSRVAELDPTGRGERQRMDSITFEKTEWLGRPDSAQKYSSDHFTLVTDAGEEISRRAAVRLELVTAALKRYFPPLKTTSNPTTVYLCSQPDDYRQYLSGRAILNPAIFDPAKNRIVCGSNLKALGDQLTGTRLHHQRQYQAIDEYEAGIRKLYRDQKSELDRFLATAGQQRKRVAAAESANDLTFDRATKQLFAVLYHETFHAYWHTSGAAALPRWLDEGLAQVFESAIFEAGELRVDHLDRDRLKSFLAKPVPIRDVLLAKSDDFLARHVGDRAMSDRLYYAAWANASMLLVLRPVIGTDRFRTFVATADRDPIAAFEAWIGMSCDEWDRLVIKRLSEPATSGKATP